MNMKTAAQDIPTSTVLCLAVGLLVGTMLMPERHKSEYMVDPPVVQASATTRIDANEGRLLERCPEGFEHSNAKVSESPSTDFHVVQKAIPDGQVKDLAIQELFGLLLAKKAAWNATVVSDTSACMLLALFAIVGMLMSYTDVSEISEQSKATPGDKHHAESAGIASQKTLASKPAQCVSPLIKDAERPQYRHSWHKFLKYGFISTVAFSYCCVSVAIDEALDLSNIKQLVVQLANVSFETFVPDKLLMLALGASALLGAGIMRIDFEEMAEELRRASKHEASAHVPAETCGPVVKSAQLSECWSQRLKYMALAAVGIGFCSAACAMWIALSPHFGNPLGPDKSLLLACVASAMLGAAVMRIDFLEMKDAMQNDLKLNAPPPVSAKVPVVEGAPASESTSYQFLMYVAITSAVVGCGGACFAICMASRSVDVAQHAMFIQFLDQHRACVLDSVLLLLLGVSAILGVAVMQFDIHEMIQELQKTPKPNMCKAAPPAPTCVPIEENLQSSECTSYRLLKYAALASMVIGSCGATCAMWMCAEVFEIPMLGEFFDRDHARVLDQVLILVLGAGAMLGVAVMQVDVHEMIEEMQNASERTSSTSTMLAMRAAVAESPQASSKSSSQVALRIVALASMIIGHCGAMYGVWFALASLGDTRDAMLAELFDVHRLWFHDTALVLLLGAGALLGVAVMEADVHGMKKEMQNVAEPKASTSPHVPVAEKTQVSQCLSHRLLKYVAVASVVAGSCGAAMALGMTLGMASTFVAVTSDQGLMLVLGSAAAFGAVLSHVDIHEMSEDMRKQKAD